MSVVLLSCYGSDIQTTFYRDDMLYCDMKFICE